jgi:HEAT repeat protein
MNDCPELLTTQELLDGELSGEAAARASNHLRTCAACQAFATEIGSVDSELRAAAPDSEVPHASSLASATMVPRPRRPAGWLIAAALLLALTPLLLLLRDAPIETDAEMAELLDAYSTAIGVEREKIEIRMLRQGPDVAPLLVRFLNDDNIARKNAAVRMLATFNDRAVAQLIWDHAQAHDMIGGEARDVLLSDFGDEPEDLDALFVIMDDPDARIGALPGDQWALFELDQFANEELRPDQIDTLRSVGFQVPEDGTTMRSTVRDEILERLHGDDRSARRTAVRAIAALDDLYYYEPLLDVLETADLGSLARQLFTEKANENLGDDPDAIRSWYDSQIRKEKE